MIILYKRQIQDQTLSTARIRIHICYQLALFILIYYSSYMYIDSTKLFTMIIYIIYQKLKFFLSYVFL